MSVIENFLPSRFQILGELGRGGTSIVFHARDTEYGGEVAVKVLLKDSQEDRFQREAERLASISHPNVVTFLEVGRHEGRDFLVMEYLEVGDLSSYVGALPLVDILRLFSQICDGLAHLHDRGIIHRDIKPANILVSKEGQPKITDLGVARQMERNTRLTQAGTILGTYSYLAPEQILSSSVGPAADIYSLGVCLFCALTGRKPFESDNEFNMLKAHLEEAPPNLREFLPEAPELLENLVNLMLAKEPEERPRSARAVADYLQDCIKEIEERDEEPPEPVWEDKFEELPDEQRSVLLAITYLGGEASFETICQATPFSEDKTDRCLELLLEDKLVNSPTDDSFSLTFPGETLETRLTPRLRKLFASRLATLAEASSAETQVEREPTPTPKSVDTAEEPAPAKSREVPKPSKVSVAPPEPEPVPAPPDPAPVPSPAPTPSRAPAPEPVKQGSSALRWLFVALMMLAVGTALGMGGQWYYNHSGVLQVTAEPKGAKVIVNGKELGEAPRTVKKLKPGEHVVEVSLDGYASREEKVSLEFMQTRQVHLSLDPLVGELHLKLKPKDAFVTIGEQEYGEVSSEIELTSGTHVVQAKKEGYKPYKEEVEVPEDRPLELEISLTPITTTLKTTSKPEGATVRIDGKDSGLKTPCVIKKLSYGTHQVELRLKGHSLHQDEVKVSSEEELSVHGVLKILPGDLVITSEPSGAKLKLNGEVKGKTPQTLRELKADTYTITLIKDGYKIVQGTKTVVAGEKIKAHFKMTKKPKPKPNPPPDRPYEPPPRYKPPPRYVPPPSRPPPPPSGSGGSPWIID